MTTPALEHWNDPLQDINARDHGVVAEVFHEAARAALGAACRQGSVDVIEPEGTLLATGDLHDNPVHFARVVELAGLPGAAGRRPHHITLHEVIHSDRLVGGVDLSHRALLRVAALKLKDPEEVHAILANHELSQVIGAGIVKEGVRVVDAFNEGVGYVFGDDAPGVIDAIAEFIRAMPLALVCRPRDGSPGLLCAHSLPGPELMSRFDPAILERPLEAPDYEPRKGSAHLMVWGRGHKPAQLESLAERWNVKLFVLGHQHAPTGWMLLPPNAVVLNSEHHAGVVLPLDLGAIPDASAVEGLVRPLAG